MQIQEFIKSACEKIQSVFPFSKVEYQYKSISDTHFIKVLPSSIFEEEKFIDLDFELTDEFENQFSGDLCFLKDDSLTELEAPTFVCEPIESEFTKIEYSFNTISELNSSFEALQNHINSVISNFKKEDFKFSYSFDNINIIPSHKDSNLLIEELPVSIITNDKVPEKQNLRNRGNNRYAMAA